MGKKEFREGLIQSEPYINPHAEHKKAVKPIRNVCPIEKKKTFFINEPVIDRPTLYTRWTKREDEILREFFPVEGDAVSKRLDGRTVAACQMRAFKLGIERKAPYRNGRWQEEEDNILRMRYPVIGIKVISELPWRTKNAIRSRAVLLGLHKDNTLQMPGASCFYFAYHRKRKLHTSNE